MDRGTPRGSIEADPGAQAERAGLGPDPPADADRPAGRGGELSLVGGGYAILAAGFVLLGAVVIAPDSDLNNGLTAIAGALAIVLGAAIIAELIDRRIAATLGAIGGLALGVSALAPAAIEGPEIGRLIGGALLLMGSAGVLSARRGKPGTENSHG